MAKRSKASQAAAKGWATRRANAARQARSEAARRGWAARRAKAEKRSQAARKGWETRRQAERPEPPAQSIDLGRERTTGKVRWYETEEIERVGGEKGYKSKKGGK